MLQIARMAGNKKAGAACAQQAAPAWDKYPITGWQQDETGYRLPPARSAPDFGVYHPYPRRKRALFHAPPRKLIEFVGGIPQQRNQLPQLRQVELYHIAINGHLSHVRRHVVRAEQRHLLSDKRPFLRRHADLEQHIPLLLRHISVPAPCSLQRGASAPPPPVAAWSGRMASGCGAVGCGPPPWR